VDHPLGRLQEDTMLSLWLVLSAIGLLGLSGLPACLLTHRSLFGQRMTATLMVLGSVLGWVGLGLVWWTHAAPAYRTPWFLPWGEFIVSLDELSAVFLAPIFVLPALGAVYGLEYWKQTKHRDNGHRLGVFYGVLAGSMALVVIARDGVLFLIAWEAMALAAFFAATAEDRKPKVRRAGWVYLIATHTGTLCLLALFALWRHATGSFALNVSPLLPDAMSGTLFVLALVGFGFKAGLFPLHVWLPAAHANAPSHVSAVMSGVMLKMGVYGLVRMTSLLPVPPPWWGAVVLAVGTLTGIAGIAFALSQHDIKRLLAYSSVENMGIIAMGLGLALLGRATGRDDWVVLGLGGALLHVWNHALFKSLLFLVAGAVIHAAGTREMDRLGGLAKRMPRVTTLFVVGAIAICALPPLNGFTSEVLVYLGLFRTLSAGGTMALAAISAVGLSMIGALAVACFVKLLSAVFLGAAKSDATERAHDPTASMFVPMCGLAVGCVGLGVLPVLVLPLLGPAVDVWAGPSDVPARHMLGELVPFGQLSLMACCLVGLLVTMGVIGRRVARQSTIRRTGTWDCGYAQPSARMQYTGSSFVQQLVSLFSFLLWPRVRWPQVMGPLPRKSHFKTTNPDTVLDRLVRPVFQFAGHYLPRLRVLQQGQTQYYVLYILITVLVLLVWGVMGTGQ
jgi:hydrogenase-4 component B